MAKIIERFDPRICMPAAGVKLLTEDSDKVYIYDGQHRLMVCALLGMQFCGGCSGLGFHV